MKRLFSMFLAASMLFSMSPTVFAETTPQETAAEETQLETALSDEKLFRQNLDEEKEFLSAKMEAETYLLQADAPVSGQCGPNLTWTFSDNTLTISGTGAMTNYNSDSSFPWYAIKSKVRTLVIGEGVTSLSKNMFSNLYNLESIVAEAENTAYSSKDGVLFNKDQSILIRYPESKRDASYTIPNSVVTVRENAFDNAYDLTALTVSASVIDFENNYFWRVYNLTSITVDAANPVFSSENGVLFDKNKTTLLRYPTDKSDTSYTIPDGIFTIQERAFYNISYLQELNLPASVVTIGENALSSYSPLHSINVNDANTAYSSADGVLFDKNQTTLILYPQQKTASAYSIPDSVLRIDDNAFGDVQALTAIHLPASLTDAGRWPFESCRSLTAITVDGDNSAYTAVNGVLFNKGQTILYRYPSSKADTSYTIPGTVETIHSDAFWCCSNLKTLTIPASVQEISSNFNNCNALESISVASSNPAYTTVNGVLFNADKTELIRYPAGNTAASYTVPDSVTTIADNAFAQTAALTSVIVPASVKKINYSAFYDCEALTSLTIYGNPDLSNGEMGLDRSCTIYGMTGSTAEAYANEYGYTFVSTGTYTPEILASGTYGTITWSVDSLGSLSISGTGELIDAPSDSVPWINYAEQIRKVEIADGITAILSNAFQRCYYMKSITIPASVTTIDQYALRNTTNLTITGYNGTCAELYANAYRITFICLDENTETLLASGTFGDNIQWSLYDTAKLVLNGSGEMPSVSYSNIPWYDYQDCITEIVIGDGITSITNALSYHDNLLTITIPSSVTTIDQYIYLNDEAVIVGADGSIAELYAKSCGYGFTCLTADTKNVYTSGTFGDSIQWTLYDSAEFVVTGSGEITSGNFTSASNMYWYDFRNYIRFCVLEEGITKIGYNLFGGCDNLASVTFPSTLTEIDDYAFSSCGSLETITIPASVTTLGSGTFSSCNSLLSIFVDENNPNYSSDSSGVLFDKNKTFLIAYPTGRSSPSYSIPDGVATTADGAFSNSNLTTLIVPASVIEIGSITSCYRLQTIQIHADNQNYSSDSYGVLFNKDKTELILFPSRNTAKEYVIPDGVTSIGDDAFSSATYNLETITIPASVTSIGYYAFSMYNHTICCYDGTYAERYVKNNGYTYIMLDEDKVNIIAEGTCDDNLTWALDETGKLTISGTGAMMDYSYVYSIPWYSYQENIKSLVVESGVTSLGDNAFYNCYNLASATLPEGLTAIGSKAFSSTSLESITIPASVAEIGAQAFHDSNKLSSITIAEGNQSFTADENALFNKDKTVLYLYFIKNSAESYEIPSTVTTIESYAFNKVNALKNVTIPESVASIAKYAFYGNYYLNNFTIYTKNAEFAENAISTSYYVTAVTVTAHDGSTAEFYAKEKGYTFVPLEGEDLPNNIDSGTCGENVTWTLDDTGTLTISGTGAMTDYTTSSSSTAPWYSVYRSKIKSVVIENGVTSVGNYAFYGCSNLAGFTIADSVTSIGNYAFYNCDTLTSIAIPNGVTTIGIYAFSNNSDINSVTIPASVTSIGDMCFYFCSNLVDITVDGNNTVYSSENGVLFNKDKTTLLKYPTKKTDKEYTIPSTVTTIKEFAFNECRNLTKLTVPESVASVEDYALNAYYVTDLIIYTKNAVFTGNAISVASKATITAHDGSTAEFYAKEKGYTFVPLEGEDLPNNIDSGTCGENVTWTLYDTGELRISGTGAMTNYTSYYNNPWYSSYRNKIQSIVIENGVTTIGDNAFYNIYGCTSITIADSVTSIGKYAFSDIDHVEELIIPSGVTALGDGAFRYCDAITSVTIPASVTSIGTDCFYACNNLAALQVNADNTAYSSDNGVLFDKDKKTLILYPPKKTDTSYTLPAAVTTIKDYAFYSCYNLTSVTIPESLTSMGKYAFYNCSNLVDLTILAKEAVFDNSAIISCSNVTITAHDGSTAEFYAKKNNIPFIPIGGVDNPNTVAEGTCGENLTWTLNDSGLLTISGTGNMKNYTYGSQVPWYSHSQAIKSVIIKDGVTSIGGYAFYSSYDNLAEITIADSVTSIGNNAFYYCIKLTAITLPKSLTTIGNYAFQSCRGLTGITIPAAVTSIGTNIFDGCTNLTNITVDKNNTAYSSEDGVLFDKDKTILIHYPKMNPLTDYEIPVTVTEISNYAFYDSNNLINVTIPKSVAKIGMYNFYSCDKLVSATAYGRETELTSSYTLRYNNSAFKLYCYEGSTYHDHADKYSLLYEFLAEEESTEQIVTINVADSSTQKAINGAMVSILSEDGTVKRRTTGSTGKVTLTLENGTYTLQTYADGYMLRTVTVEISSSATEFTVYMSSNSVLKVETTVNELSRDEAIAAGINVNADENRQIYKCITVLEFIPVPIVTYYAGDEILETTPYVYDNIYVEEVAKNIFLIVYSEVGWLKEIFDVQLIVTNTSAVEVVTDCEANLTIPEGMSLAVMTDEIGQQSASVDLGTIEPEAHTNHHWYLTGDEAGKYTISGTVTGTRTGGGLSEDISIPFTTQDPITVLAGDAMKLTITAEKYATVGQPYRMKYTLENVSDKTLYDVSLNVLGGKFIKAYSVKEILYHLASTDASELQGSFNDGYALTDTEFKPGERLSGIFEITFGIGIDTDAIHYMLKDIFTITGAGSTTEIPTEIVIVDKIDVHSWGNRQVIKEATCTEEGLIRYTCTDSGCSETLDEVIPALGHAYASTRTVDTASTCTEPGEASYHCTRDGCDAKKDVFPLDALGHKFGEWNAATEATCTTDGEGTHSCEREGCSYSETTVIPALGHLLSEWETTKTETCTEDGSKSRSCQRNGCDYTETETISMLGHDFTNWITNPEPTCTEDGSKSRSCQRDGCDYTETEAIPKLGHDFSDWITNPEPTCTEDGSKSRSCQRNGCDYTETEAIPMLGHDLTNWNTNLEPTCTEDGSKSRSCQRGGCDYTETETITMLGHDHAAEFTTDKYPTCTEAGEKSRHCSRCDDRADITVLAALSHDLTDWTVVTEPTCTDDGKQIRSCKRGNCSYSESEVIAALGHSWDSGVVTKSPTADEEGVRTYTCNICNDTKTQVLPKLQEQELGFTSPQLTYTYGQMINGKPVSVYNEIWNDSETDPTLTYTSSDEEVATVDEQGKTTIHGAGQTIITVVASAVEGYLETTDSYTLIIKKAPLTITADNTEIFYGETWTETLGSCTADGFVLSEDTEVLEGTAVYACDYPQYGKVGDYTISVSGLTAKNYEITFTAGTLTVKKAPEHTITLGRLVQRKGNVSDVTAEIVPQDDTAIIQIEYQLTDGSWTTTVPAEPGEYTVRAALVSSDNLEVPSNPVYTNGTLTIKPGASVGGQSVSITQDENGNYEIAVDDETVDTIVNNTPENGEVVIDVLDNDGAAQKSELIIPENLIDKMADSDKVDSVTIIADQTEITMDSDVLNTIAERTEANDKINVSIDPAAKDDMNDDQQAALDAIGQDAVVLELTLTVTHTNEDGTQTTESLHELNGDVKVRAKYDLPADQQNKRVLVCYVADDGSVTYIRAKYVDGFVEFTTTHFSYFAILNRVIIPGDVNGKAGVTTDDLALLQAYFAGHTDAAGKIILEAADVDGNPGVTRADAMYLARYLAQWPGYSIPSIPEYE